MLGRRRFFHSALLVAALLLPAACDSAEERAAKHYQRGVELAEQGEPEKAILEFRNALRADELHAPALYGIAEALEARGDLRGAVGHLQRVIEIDPSHVEARVKLAQAMLLGGALDEAAKHAEAAYAVAPKNPDVLAVRAAVTLRLGEPEKALIDAKAALALAPDHPEAGMILVAERISQGDMAQAMQLVDRFLEKHPEHLALNLVKLQLLAQDESRQDELVGHIQRMIELSPQDRGLRLALVQAQQRQGDTAAAIAAMRELVALDPADVQSVLQFVGFLRQAEGEEAARAELEARIAAAADAQAAFPYQQAFVELDLAAGDRPAAVARLDRLIEEQDLAKARIARARLHLEDQEQAEARVLIDDVLGKDPNNVDALAMRAAIEIDAGDADAALLTLRSALNEEPDRLDLLRLAAVAHDRMGDIQLAGENLAAAVRVSDYAPEHVLAYARFLRQRQRTDAAATVLDEALRRHPQNRDLLVAAAEIRLAMTDWLAAENLATRLKELGDEESAALAERITAAAFGGQGRLGETIELLEGLTAKDDEGAAFVQLAQSYIRAGDVEKATALVEGALERNPGNATALLIAGALHQMAGETEAAEASFRKAVEAAPEAPGPRLALMRLSSERGDMAGARAAIEAGIAAVPAPANQSLRMALAGLQELQGDIAGAIETYRGLYDERPDSLVVANNLVSLLTDHRADDAESLDFAARVARRLSGTSVPQFQDTYGWALFLKGEHGPALDALRQAVKGLPENPWVQFHIGQTYAALGDSAKAREHLERARELGGADFPRLAEIEATLREVPDPTSN
jgi:cellulose synthase operon protein C